MARPASKDGQSTVGGTDGVRPAKKQVRPKKPKQERSIETREKLLDAAVELLSRSGQRGFSTSAVAELANVSRGALQYHFLTRDDIIVAVRLRANKRIALTVSVSELQALGVRDRLASIIRTYWDFFGSQLYVAIIEIRLYERSNPEVHKALMDGISKVAEERNRDWVRIFADVPHETETLVEYRRFMLDVMRGLALRQIEEGAFIDPERHLSMLAEAMMSLMSSE